jgi:hypothetical protein
MGFDAAFLEDSEYNYFTHPYLALVRENPALVDLIQLLMKEGGMPC